MSVRLELRRLMHRYWSDGTEALRDISLDVPAGTLMTVLGPSGSGKSTLLALVAGIESVQAGDVLFDGRSVRAVPAQKRGVALVLQRPYLFPYLTVGENVAFGLAARGVGRATRAVEADRWLAMVGLDGMAPRRPQQLSGGEQQRVALVRALATTPRVLLLDEPLASLDPRGRELLQGTLRAIVSETGVTSLMVTHDLSEAMSLGDRVAVLDNGRLAADATPQQLFQRPPTRRAAELVGISTFVEGIARVGELETRAGSLVVDGLADGGGRRVVVAIRPEHVWIAERQATNAIRGVVERCTFRGEYWDTCVRTALGPLRARSATAKTIGADARVSLPARHLFVLGDPAPPADRDGQST